MRSRRHNSTSIERAQSALSLLDVPIEWNEHSDSVDGDQAIKDALEAMASALVELKSIALSEPSTLDEILASIDASDRSVELAAELTEVLSHSNYLSGLSVADARRAEALREELVAELESLLHEADDSEEP